MSPCPRPHVLAAWRTRRRHAAFALAAVALAVGVVGCGGGASAKRSTAPPAPPGGGQATTQAFSATCSSTASIASAQLSGSCVYALTDGRRFKCPGSTFARSTPSPSALEHAPGCVPLPPLVIPAGLRAVAAEIDAVQYCLTKQSLRVTGGLIPTRANSISPDGELIVGNGNGGAFVAFYADPRRAGQLEPQITQNARRFGGQVERRGGVTVVFIHHPSSSLRHALLPCAFQ